MLVHVPRRPGQRVVVIGREGGAAFSPLSLAPFTWLRFQDLGTLFTTAAGSTNVAADDDPIGRAEDKSGNANHWTQSVEVSRPTWKPSVVNGHAVARHNGTAGHLAGPDLSSLTAGEAFIILAIDADPPAASQQSGLWNMGSAAQTTHYSLNGDGTIFDEFGTDTRKTTVNPTPSLEEFRLYNVVSTASEWTSFLDGAELFTTGTNTVGFAATPFLGASDPGIVMLDGDIAEFILFDRKLAAEEKTSLKSYFASRYALTIA